MEMEKAKIDLERSKQGLPPKQQQGFGSMFSGNNNIFGGEGGGSNPFANGQNMMDEVWGNGDKKKEKK